MVAVYPRLFGIGFGLLIRRVLACLATCSPLVIWLLMGAVAPLRPARAWLLPVETAGPLRAAAFAAAIRRGRLVRR